MASQKNATMEAWYAAETRASWQKEAVKDYNKAKGYEITVNWVRAGNGPQLLDKLVVATASGSGLPDMADVIINEIGKLLKTPNPPLLAFNDYLRGKEKDFFMPSFADPWSANGKIYGLGNELNVVLFAYRHDLFDKAGIKAPLKTWNEAMEAGRTLSSIAPEGLFFVSAGPIGTFHTLAIQAGGGYLENGNRLIIDHEQNVKALQFIVDSAHRLRATSLIPSARPEKDQGNALRKAALNSGAVAAEIGPSWRISGGLRADAPDTEGRWMVQPLPQWSTSGPRRTTSQGGTGMSVLKESKYKDIAADFVIWEHSTKAVLHDYDQRQVWPTYKKVYDDPRLSEPVPWFNNQRVGTLLKQEAETMLPFYQGVWWPEIAAAAGKHITAAIKNEKPVRQALQEAQAEAKAAIETAGGRIDGDGRITS
ncbi:MAG TPA: extracellular solute-binding protein [Chloroflexota bacterium]|nr:extracellular solute-binding protein [Chloroflexota bacterium]